MYRAFSGQPASEPGVHRFDAPGSPVDLCRVRDGGRVDVVMARRADDEGRAPHFCHEGCPRGLARPGPAELAERGDLVDGHCRAVLARFAPPFTEPVDQLPAGVACPGRCGSWMTARLSCLRGIPPNRATRSVLPGRCRLASKQVLGPWPVIAFAL